ncbi:alkylphosphonate transporter [Mycolicibacterium chubuense]|uniref:alkylphosphonate transporter n=1 Tax=Mycolicibacterium chubuense TaxID=1800 RepID=UPI0003128BDB|nr:alkylphosphonate transporter [Mycolicibacterium chubuense]
MRDGGFTSSVAFRFAQHPQCPNCGGRRSKRIQYGMPADPESWEPWVSIGGCCVSPEKWECQLCEHQWS